jgi:hypothetical protein
MTLQTIHDHRIKLDDLLIRESLQTEMLIDERDPATELGTLAADYFSLLDLEKQQLEEIKALKTRYLEAGKQLYDKAGGEKVDNADWYATMKAATTKTTLDTEAWYEYLSLNPAVAIFVTGIEALKAQLKVMDIRLSIFQGPFFKESKGEETFAISRKPKRGK